MVRLGWMGLLLPSVAWSATVGTGAEFATVEAAQLAGAVDFELVDSFHAENIALGPGEHLFSTVGTRLVNFYPGSPNITVPAAVSNTATIEGIEVEISYGEGLRLYGSVDLIDTHLVTLPYSYNYSAAATVGPDAVVHWQGLDLSAFACDFCYGGAIYISGDLVLEDVVSIGVNNYSFGGGWFQVDSAGSFVLDGADLQGGTHYAPWIDANSGASVEVRNVTMSGQYMEQGLVNGHGIVLVEDVLVSQSTGYGHVFEGDVVTASRVDLDDGGGLGLFDCDECILDTISVSGGMGYSALVNGDIVTVVNSSFSNLASYYIPVFADQELTVEATTFNGTNSYYGGLLYTNGELELTDVVIRDSVMEGVFGNNVTVTNSTFVDNTVEYAALFRANSDVEVSDSLFVNNLLFEASIADADDLHSQHNRFCGNAATGEPGLFQGETFTSTHDLMVGEEAIGSDGWIAGEVNMTHGVIRGASGGGGPMINGAGGVSSTVVERSSGYGRFALGTTVDTLLLWNNTWLQMFHADGDGLGTVAASADPFVNAVPSGGFTWSAVDGTNCEVGLGLLRASAGHLHGADGYNDDGSVGNIGLFGGEGAPFLDNDADGVPDAVDCDPEDLAVGQGVYHVPDTYDSDGDGVPTQDGFEFSIRLCSTLPGFVERGAGADCDDADANVSATYRVDADGDGAYGAAEFLGCDPGPNGTYAVIADEDLDCDDADDERTPAGAEVCDGVDNDCNGLPDDDATDAREWFVPIDEDGDGFVGSTASVMACGAPVGASATEPLISDCVDDDAGINPGAAEVWYDGTDQDCDGADDDQDGDGFVEADDCDDTDESVFPGATERWYDGIDQDCDGNDDDQDGDGVSVGEDCDDLDASVNPSADEIYYDGIDQDCDGNDADADGDGFVREVDCNDEDAEIYPGAPEEAGDGVDSDCNGADVEVYKQPKTPDLGGCSTAGGAPAASGLLVALLLGARRRR